MILELEGILDIVYPSLYSLEARRNLSIAVDKTPGCFAVWEDDSMIAEVYYAWKGSFLKVNSDKAHCSSTSSECVTMLSSAWIFSSLYNAAVF